MTNQEWTHQILDFKTAVSDTLQFTCGSASISCFDPKRGRIYTVYHASRTKYGEARDVYVMAIIPVAQPHKAINRIIVEHEVPIDGVTYRNIIDGNCMFLDGKVRIFFLSDGRQYFYLDYLPETDTFTTIQPVCCSFDGNTRTLTDDAVADYLHSRGMTGWKFDDPHEHIINTSRMYFYQDWWYSCITSYWCQPIIYRTKDGSVFEFVGIINKVGQYETQTAILHDRMYALIRGAEGDNFYISDDFGQTFKPCGRLEFNTTRPQMLVYHDQLLIFISEKGILPNLVRDGRNNMKLLAGEGENLSKYKEVFQIVDPRGIVYYDIIDYKGVLYMTWSNADLYIEDIPSYADRPAAKDLIYYTKIGDLTEYL